MEWKLFSSIKRAGTKYNREKGKVKVMSVANYEKLRNTSIYLFHSNVRKYKC